MQPIKHYTKQNIWFEMCQLLNIFVWIYYIITSIEYKIFYIKYLLSCYKYLFNPKPTSTQLFGMSNIIVKTPYSNTATDLLNFELNQLFWEEGIMMDWYGYKTILFVIINSPPSQISYQSSFVYTYTSLFSY